MSNIYVAEPPTKGKVVLHTTHGPISIALWSKECPKTTRNFVQLALEDYYNGTVFHRIIKDFLIQGGDRTNTGLGCDSIYGEPYPNEFHSRLKFRYRGLVGVASAGVAEKGGASTNGSQFFITMGRDDSFNNKYTLFGKVVDDTVYNLDRISQANVDTNDFPTDDPPPHIIRAEVVENPFTDIIPRDIYRQVVDHAEEERDNRRKEKIEVSNKKGLLSFEDEDSSSSESEDDEDGNEKRIAVKVKSAHDGGDASLLAETAKSGDALGAVKKESSLKAAARRAKMLQKDMDRIRRFTVRACVSRIAMEESIVLEASKISMIAMRSRRAPSMVIGNEPRKLGILPSEAKAMRESELERQRQIEKMRQKIRQVNRVEDTSQKETKGPMGIADRANKYKRREKRGKKAYQELDVFMNEEASKAHEREEEGPEVVNGESSTSARAAAEDTEITAEPGTLAETMQFAFGEDTGALGADGDAFGGADWLHGRDTSAHSKGLKFAIDSTRAYQLDEERAQKVLEVYDPLDPNAGPPKERREENRPKRPRRDDDDEERDRHHRHHR
ncbi:Peptidyl-prolyl isomerase cwc27 [Perkinsus olseni]|uniref:Peptidyl-prolyl isomerase cwc27 n=1 Tax=Perkinsus olseni TaxID=32597 RepID=A0A7J6NS85_PEROL|nr:Peptidyl-prolyl isomerase cwc27 [Perkinsus olseni]